MLSSWLAQSMVVGSSTPPTFSSSTSVLPLGHHQGFCSVLVLSTVQIVDNFRKTQPHFIVITMAAVSLSERLSDAAMKINAVTTLLWGMTPFDGRFALGHAKVCVGTRRKVNGKSSAAESRMTRHARTHMHAPPHYLCSSLNVTRSIVQSELMRQNILECMAI